MIFFFVFFFKQKTAYEMRISDWSSDVCSSDLNRLDRGINQRCAVEDRLHHHVGRQRGIDFIQPCRHRRGDRSAILTDPHDRRANDNFLAVLRCRTIATRLAETRSEEHTSALTSLMRLAYAVICLTKTKHIS